MMRGRFQRFTARSGGCPVCGNTDGKCSQLAGTDLHFCRTNPNSSPDEERWVFRGTCNGAAAGFWGRFVPFKEHHRKRDWRETYWEDREQDEAAALALRKAIRKPPAPRPAPHLRPGFIDTPTCNLQQRAEAYGALFNGWSLTRHHRQQLSDRYGWEVAPDNEHTTGVISVNTVVNFDWHRPFPGGVGPDHCTKFRDGMALSITDERGQILGVELKPDDPLGGGKYRWLSRPEHCELGIPEYDGEYPLGIFPPVRWNQIYGGCTGNDLIAISEGRGMKPRIAAARWGIPVIGGGGHAAATSSPIQLNRYLLLNPDAAVLLLVDAGGLENRMVVSNILLTARFCRQRGHEVLIPWWDQRHAKQDPDPDEVPFSNGMAEADGRRFILWEDTRYVPLWRPEDLRLEV